MYGCVLLLALYSYHTALILSVGDDCPRYGPHNMLTFAPVVLRSPLPNYGDVILWLNLLRTILIVSESIDDEKSVLERLFPDLGGRRHTGKDVWYYLVNNGVLFWHLTEETPETFEAIYRSAYPFIVQRRNPRLSNIGPPSRIRPCLLTPRNRLLMVFIWMRQYCREELVCALFDLSLTTVSDEIHHIMPILWYLLRYQIQWPNIVQWSLYRNSWPSFPNALGAIDCTIHRIWRPTVRQASYYRGDKKVHFLSTIIIVNTDGIPVYVKTGFPGHMNDAGVYHTVPAIGGVGPLQFPAWGKLLADGGFPDTPPLITPWRAPRLVGYPLRQLMNEDLTFYRSTVEHSIGDIKVFAAATDIYRHRRSFQPIIIETVCFLSARREQFLADLA